MSQKDLDRITDVVLAHDPAKKPDLPLKVIAGAPDRPLDIGGIEIPCYVLENKQRVLAQRGMAIGLGMSSSAGGHRFRVFMGSGSIKSFISKELLVGIENPILFKNPAGGGVAYGYPATLLVDVCNTVLAARDAGVLTKQQDHIANRCDVLIRALAHVGIIALVDEATGYQRIREENALATILEKLIAKELNPWTRTFPLEFYDQICRLKKWPNFRAVKRPSVIGKYTNDLIYDRLAPGLLEELQERNPRDQGTGRRGHKHHQWFTPDIGHPKLKERLEGVIALMITSKTWDSFKRKMDIAYPKIGTTIPMNLDDDED